MDWLLIALVLALATVAAVLCVVRSRCPNEKRPERVIFYHNDGYEIEPANVPKFQPTWRHVELEDLSVARLKLQNPKGGSRA